MSDYLFLVPISLTLGLLALAAFLWALRDDQYDDLDGAAERVLFDEDRPILEQRRVSRSDREDGLDEMSSAGASDGEAPP